MAAKGAAVLPLLRRELRSSVRVPRFAASSSSLSTVAHANSASASSHLTKVRVESRPMAAFSKSQSSHGQIRRFSQSSLSRADEEDVGFDPSQVERESDQVDVCIVGGGMRLCPISFHPNLNIYMC